MPRRRQLPGPRPSSPTPTAGSWTGSTAVAAEVDAAFDRYEFGSACEALYHFAWDEVCDWYLELAKIQFAAQPFTDDSSSTAEHRAAACSAPCSTGCCGCCTR